MSDAGHSHANCRHLLGGKAGEQEGPSIEDRSGNRYRDRDGDIDGDV